MTYVKAGDDETWPLRQHRQHRLRAVPGTCRVGRAPARRLSSQTALAGSEDCCSEPGSDPLSRRLLTLLTVIFERRAHPDYSASGSAFTTEGNLEAERAKKCLRPTQVAGEGARIFGPAGPVTCLPRAFNADPQKIGGAADPRAALAHELPHASGDRVGVDHALDRRLAIVRVGAGGASGEGAAAA